MVIRPATTRDARGIARVQVRGWQIGYRGIIPDDFLARFSVEEFTNRWLGNLAELKRMETIVAEDLCARAAALGARIRSAFAAALAGCPEIKDIRGSGLMIGIELDRPCAELVAQAADAGLLINVTAERVVRLLPPLILSDADADRLVAILAPLIKTFVNH